MKRIIAILAFAVACGDSTGPSDSVSVIARTSLALGARFACGLSNGGRAYCWGEGQFGAIGDSTLNQRFEPTAVAGGRAFATISAGERTVCALDDAGQVFCWGEDPTQVIGTTTGLKNTPQRVDSPVAFKAISVGRRFVCGLAREDGAAYCWGDNGRGQLGVGDSLPHPRPTRVVGGITFASLSSGFIHACGLTADGAAYCWGENAYAALGTNNLTSTARPARVSGSSKFSSIAAGAAHTCGIATTGETLCWGSNFAGQLGDGSTTTRTAPVVAAAGRSFTTLRAARGNSILGHTCGLEANGTAYCWGANGKGQLGNGPSSSPCVGIDDNVFENACSYVALRVSSLTGALAIDVGQEYSCALTAGGRGFCWGENVHGELGDGSGVAQAAPVRIAGSVTFP